MAMAAHPSQMPQPGESFVTPQAWRVATRGDIEAFFDTATYQSKPVNTSVKPPKQVPMERHTTKENIVRFFDPTTYSAQKRPSASPPPQPAAKARVHPSAGGRMDRAELVEKFKLAAKLNGVSWDELCDPWIQFQVWV